MDDPFDLARFVSAQASVIDVVRAELRAGAKRTHWMWFVFPQARALGRSLATRRYGIGSHAEAAAFLAHPVLGSRLRDCIALVSSHRDRIPADIFPYPDDLKFRSSMTLFAAVAGSDDPVFAAILSARCGGPDPLTVELLSRPDRSLD